MPHSAASSAAEVAEQVVVKRAARQCQPVQLVTCGGHDGGVAVPEVQRRVAGEAVEVTAAVDVGDPRAEAFVQDDGQRMVGVRGVLVVERDVRSGCGARLSP